MSLLELCQIAVEVVPPVDVFELWHAASKVIANNLSDSGQSQMSLELVEKAQPNPGMAGIGVNGHSQLQY